MCDDDRKQRHRGVEDGGHGRVDGLLTPGDEKERDGDIGNAKQKDREPFLKPARQGGALNKDDDQCEEESEQHTESNQGDRTDLRHGNLDP